MLFILLLGHDEIRIYLYLETMWIKERILD